MPYTRVDELYRYGNIFANQGCILEAISCYEEVLQMAPDHPEANNNLAVMLSELGRDVEAFPYFERAISVAANYIDAIYNYANTLRKVVKQQNRSHSTNEQSKVGLISWLPIITSASHCSMQVM